MHMRLIGAALSLLFFLQAATADEMGPRFVPDSYGIRNAEPPRSTLAALAREDPDVVLPPPAARLLERETNPPTVGIVRNFVEISTLGRPARSVRSTGAVRVRLYLTGVSLPSGSVAWVFGDSNDAVPFGDELSFNDTIWTPSVAGDVIRLLLPAGARASIAAIGHQARGIATNGVDCFIDASCATFDSGELSDSTSAIYFVSEGVLTYCSAGLINAKVEDRLLLTSNHCLKTQAEAASVEAYWDLRTSSCNGAYAAFTRTYGATLLVTSAATDMTLLRMNSLPGGRWLMGWTTDTVAPGTLLHRISHPQDPISLGPFRQRYAITSATSQGPTCTDLPRSHYLYSTRVTGGVGDGSSGAPVVKAGGYIVGQLFGTCDAGEDDGCSNSTQMVDGSLRVSYALLQPFLNPAGTSGCTPNSKTVCLLGNRFRVAVNYRNQFASPPQPGDFVAARLNASAVNPDVGIFGLTDPQATEIMVRIADSRPYAPRFDVYYGGLTDLEYWVNVTDTVTGTTRSYHNAPGKLSAGLDRSSFPAN